MQDDDDEFGVSAPAEGGDAPNEDPSSRTSKKKEKKAKQGGKKGKGGFDSDDDDDGELKLMVGGARQAAVKAEAEGHRDSLSHLLYRRLSTVLLT